jgi:pimeloyl-ACP methyl ester carboxylesterase
MKKMKKIRCFILFASFLFGGLSTVAAAVNEQLVDLVKPNGTTLRYLSSTDSAISSAPEVGVILFSGSQGQVNLASGIPQPGANFLIRSRQLFTQAGLPTAVYDPSADIGAMSDQLRMSQAHVDEVAMVLNDFKKKTGIKKVILVGTSRGTVSAAYIATKLKNEVNGVVLTSTLFSASKGGEGLSRFDFNSITQPLLFVHHVADGCKVTRPEFAKALVGKFPVIWVEGVVGTERDACGPFSAHGYLGREAGTVRAIADWILTGKVTAKIDS